MWSREHRSTTGSYSYAYKFEYTSHGSVPSEPCISKPTVPSVHCAQARKVTRTNDSPLGRSSINARIFGGDVIDNTKRPSTHSVITTASRPPKTPPYKPSTVKSINKTPVIPTSNKGSRYVRNNLSPIDKSPSKYSARSRNKRKVSHKEPAVSFWGHSFFVFFLCGTFIDDFFVLFSFRLTFRV